MQRGNDQFSPVMQFDNIVDKGSWCVSSAELDHGVGMIIDGNECYFMSF